MREPDVILQPKGPIVYAWLDDSTVIYVGMSTVGLSRPLIASHKAYRQGLLLHVWYCSSSTNARLLERQLILKFQPELNIQLKGELSESQTKWILEKSEIQTGELVSWRTNPRGAQPFEHPRLGAALKWCDELAESGSLDAQGITELDDKA